MERKLRFTLRGNRIMLEKRLQQKQIGYFIMAFSILINECTPISAWFVFLMI